MGYKKPKEVSRRDLEIAPLPNHAQSYKVISHKFVIDNTVQLLTNKGFEIIKEVYKANHEANVAQGIYYIKPKTESPLTKNETELGMMFAWTNSYDKSIRFQCSIGAYVFVCDNGMVCGEANFARKHTGTADLDIVKQISNQVNDAGVLFQDILNDRNELKKIHLSKRQQAELAGRLYYEKELIEPSQITVIKKEMDEASFDYDVDQENAWAFYNHVTHALKKTHPRSWLANTKAFHDFMTMEFLSNSKMQSSDIPNQLDLFDIEMIEEAVDMNLEQSVIDINKIG